MDPGLEGHEPDASAPEQADGATAAADNGARTFEATAVARFLEARQRAAVTEAKRRAREKRLKAVEEEAIALWKRARQSS